MPCSSIGLNGDVVTTVRTSNTSKNVSEKFFDHFRHILFYCYLEVHNLLLGFDSHSHKNDPLLQKDIYKTYAENENH